MLLAKSRPKRACVAYVGRAEGGKRDKKERTKSRLRCFGRNGEGALGGPNKCPRMGARRSRLARKESCCVVGNGVQKRHSSAIFKKGRTRTHARQKTEQSKCARHAARCTKFRAGPPVVMVGGAGSKCFGKRSVVFLVEGERESGARRI